jgi:DNA polymerase-1
VFVYQVGLAVEKETDWGNGLWTLHADFDEAKQTLLARIASIQETLGADQLRFALSCSTESGFRREVCPSYKSNRKDKRKPVIYAPLRDFLLNERGAILRDQLEADDIIGVLATQPCDERRIIVSVDKDYNGVPGLFYKINDEFPEVKQTTVQDALLFHATQTLTGDRVDGYQGIPGVGPAKAEKILAGLKPSEFWPAIKAAYKEAGLSESVALTNARLARILQHGDYDIATGKIKLWTPFSAPVATPASTKKTAPSRPTSAATKPSKKMSR